MLQTVQTSTMRRLKRWQMSTFAVTLFGYVGYYLCRQNMSAAIPLLEKEFGYTNTELGIIGSASLVVYALGKFINGPLADRIGGRKIFLTGMIGAIFANLAFTQGSTITHFTIIWCVGHYFLSMGWGGLAKMVGNWCPPEKNGTVMGFISINFQFGGVVSTLLAGAIVQAGFGWQYIFTVPAGLLFIIFILSFFASKNSPKDIDPTVQFPLHTPIGLAHIQEDSDPNHDPTDLTVNPFEVMKTLFRMRVFIVLLVYSFLTTALRNIFFFWTPKLFTDIGMGTSSAIFKSSLFPLAGCIGTIFLGWYTDRAAHRGNRANMMTLMLTGLCISLVGMYFANQGLTNIPLFIFFTTLCGFFLLGPYSLSSGCLTLDIAGSRGAGTCTGLIDGIGYLGGSAAVMAAGYFSNQWGWGSVIYILFFCAVASTAASHVMSIYFKKQIKENTPLTNGEL